MYGANSVRLAHGGALPQQTIRQGFPPNMSGSQQIMKDIVRQQNPHPGFYVKNFFLSFPHGSFNL